MNRRSILTKTGKGLMEATGKTSNLSRDLRNILKEIDGKVSVSDLSEKFERMPEPKLLEALSTMEKEGYVREFIGKQDDTPMPRGPASAGPRSVDGSDLDFTAFTPQKPNVKASEDARLQAQAQEIARQAQATRAREEAALKARAEGAARAKAEAEAAARVRAEADDKTRKQQAGVTKPGAGTPLPPLINPTVAPVAPAPMGILGAGPEAAARAQADAQARAQAVELEKARHDAEAKARRDAEERARREAAEKVKREAEEKLRREAEERRLREVAERTRREEEERARREAAEKAKREAEERAKREAEERLRREMEERARREIAERVKREEAERRQREEQERVRREAELRAQVEAEAKARVDAELRARREAEERAKREAEEHRDAQIRKKTEAEERRRRDAEEAEALERSVQEEQERAQQEAQDTAEREEEERRQEEDRARSEEEEAEQRREDEQERAKDEAKRARREEKERARAEAKARKAARARERAGEEAWRGDEEALRDEGSSLSAREIWEKRKPKNLLKGLVTLIFVALVVGVAVLPFVPLATGPYEKSAQAWLNQPVKIGTVSLTLLPLPQLKFENVVIGRDPQMKAAVIKASPDVTTLLEDRISVSSIQLDNVTLPRAFLAVLLQGNAPRRSLGAERITAKGLKIDTQDQDLGLPPLDLDARLSGGALKSASFTNSEQRLAINVEPQGGRASVEISSGALPLPIGIDIGFTDFTGKGTASASELVIPNAEVRAFGGRIFGNLRLRWSGGWSLDGDLSARQMDAVKIAGPLLGSGTVLGKGKLSMRGLLPERMILNSQLDGNFSIQKGSISNVDMARLLQGSGSGGGTTFFAELNGDFSANPNRLQVRNLKLAAGLLTGAGQLDMDPQKNLSGRMQIELRAQTAQARSTLNVSGTLNNPQFRRSN